MATSYSAFEIEAIVPLRDRDYYWVVLDLIRRSTHRVWISMFLVDIRRAFDSDRDVRTLLHALREAVWRGVDVRVIVGDSPSVLQLREMNMVSRAYLRAQRVRVRLHPGGRPGGTHDKYLVIDHSVIVVGSHNWISDSLSHTAEDSVAVVSASLNRRLSEEFLATWSRPRRRRAGAKPQGGEPQAQEVA